MSWERVWIPMLGDKDQQTKGEVLCFYQLGPWAVTLPANRGRGFVVTHLPSGAFALPFGKGGDLDYETARKVVDALFKKIGHMNKLTETEMRAIFLIVDTHNELRWEA